MDVKKSARFLGYMGLVPFIVCTALVWIMGGMVYDTALDILLYYGAVILSFLGGIHWGGALYQDPPHPYQLLLSIIPAVVGCISLLLTAQMTLTVLTIGFAGQWLIDRELMPEGWFLKLRSSLTIIVILCLAAAQLKLLI